MQQDVLIYIWIIQHQISIRKYVENFDFIYEYKIVAIFVIQTTKRLDNFVDDDFINW